MYRNSLLSSNDQTLIAYDSLSSNVPPIIETPERIHSWIKLEQFEILHKKFAQSLGVVELSEALSEIGINFSKREFSRLFLKINQNRDFLCDWNEFVSYLIYGFQEDDPSTQKESLILPISQAPMVRKSEHRSQICSIALLKAVPDDIFDKSTPTTLSEDSPEVSGIWLTASREGQIRFWSPSLDTIRSRVSESVHLKMQTWILAIEALSDVNIVCTSSTERELRFHDTIVPTFSIRMVIRSLPFAVCSLAYNFSQNSKILSRLVLGDYGGNIRILAYSPVLRGPFQSRPGVTMIDVFWSDIVKGKISSFQLKEYYRVHTEIIQTVYYSVRTNSLFCSAEYRNTKKYRGRCPGLIVIVNDDKTTFRIPLGVTTFYVDEANNIVVTGGPDTFVRIWDVFISSKPSGILTGHNGGIVKVFVQSEERKVYSIDYQKIIKVWHLTEHTLLQSFGDLVRLLPSETDLCYKYHTHSRELLVGGRKIISIKCCPRIRMDLTDGNTHSAPVSVVLYNRLFRNIVTCGLDSYIIVWDPWTGQRKVIIKNCHTKIIYGESRDIEITAACFDPLEQFLLTGARDGSLKIWNYNSAVCMRNMVTKKDREVTTVIWVVDRILAVGWDQQVTEFNDVEGREYGDPKKWPRFHGDDVTCADVKVGEGVVTATYSGEIIFWKLETGQPYRRYSVKDPTKFIELKRRPDVGEENKAYLIEGSNNINVSRFVRLSVSDSIKAIQRNVLRSKEKGEAIKAIENLKNPNTLPLSVQAVLFLQTRPMTKIHGTLFAALENGMIQVYSHHQHGGYITEFNAIHKTGDCVLTMTTDRKNRYLLTGSAFGYVKVWHIVNYCIPEAEKQHVCMPALRLQFIFLRKVRIMSRARRVVRHQKEPLLLSSYKAHLKAINSIIFINTPKIYVTGSHDCSCRLWTLGGHYLGTLGTPAKWLNISPFERMDEQQEYRIPPDIKKVASSTTMKVVSGIQTDKMKAKLYARLAEKSVAEETAVGSRFYKIPLKDPILGHHFALPGSSAVEQRIQLETKYAYTPVYTHLKIQETSGIVCPNIPPVMQEIEQESYMDFYKPEGVVVDTNSSVSSEFPEETTEKNKEQSTNKDHEDVKAGKTNLKNKL
ncbi:WD repeat-containing protein on Y chromosome [Teleopsis dalmanni]|uniref:WD repeat-containing protein on Y chromosome n=1 Tax=Teleopsis dalmanni TaxID=139649 RepID=UPI0018CF5A23|nr:WD repeat-containing protein on Y chromosome [Teleopsis dalmanni]